MTDVVIRPFQAGDQGAARTLILEGLGGHFGFIDEHLNPDLDDIALSYADAQFVVAEQEGRIVGTGAVRSTPGGDAQLSRMSTDRALRRHGVGRAILAELIDRSRQAGSQRVVLATGAGWDDATSFYRACGFREIARVGEGIVFAMAL